jgi:hypothetical protein
MRVTVEEVQCTMRLLRLGESLGARGCEDEEKDALHDQVV